MDDYYNNSGRDFTRISYHMLSFYLSFKIICLSVFLYANTIVYYIDLSFGQRDSFSWKACLGKNTYLWPFNIYI